jgi:hypothetical protein
MLVRLAKPRVSPDRREAFQLVGRQGAAWWAGLEFPAELLVGPHRTRGGDTGQVMRPAPGKSTQNTRGGYSEDAQIRAGDNGGSACGYQPGFALSALSEWSNV